MISFIVVAFQNPAALRTCLSSLVEQTETSLEVIVVDNSPGSAWRNLHADLCRMDDRIHYVNVSDRTVIDKPGIRHKYCLYTATEIGAEMAAGEWICFPNQDSYYAPVFAQRMLALAAEEYVEFIHCDIVLGGPGHGYFTLHTAPRNCAIDKTCFMLRREWFQGFPDKHSNYELADGFFVESLVNRGIKHRRLEQVLVVHN